MNDGGSAFPEIETDRDEGCGARTYSYGGMSLRDWLAGQALAGMCANAKLDKPTLFPAAAYELADAMLAKKESLK